MQAIYPSQKAPTRTPPALFTETSQQRETNDFTAGCKPELAQLAGNGEALRYLTAPPGRLWPAAPQGQTQNG